MSETETSDVPSEMDEAPAPTAPVTGQTTSGTTDGNTAETAALQAEIERWKAHSRKNEKLAKSNSEAAATLTTLESRIVDLEKAKAAAEREAAILRIAQDVGLPPVIAARVQGTTEEEMRADAESLKTVITSSTPAAPGVGGPQGKPPTTKSVDEWRSHISGRR